MKTRILFTAILVLASMTILTSCEKVKGKGEVVTESRSVENYHSISLSVPATLYYTQGNVSSLQISAQQNVLDELQTEVEGDRLTIKIRNKVVLGRHEPITVYITAPDISGLDISGSGDIVSSTQWTAGNISLNISGSGSIKLSSVICQELKGTISGSGDIKVESGSANNEELKISGSGTIDIRGVQSEVVKTATSGSGDTYIHAEDELDVTISGSGNIWYSGNPSITTHISGSGNIRKI